MRKRCFFILAVVAALGQYAHAEDVEKNGAVGTDAPEPAGFVTGLLNNALENAATQVDADAPQQYGRTITKWASTPKFGGYAVGGYKYSSEKGKHKGDGFNGRMVRLYVDGTVLTDFKYRLQLEVSGDPGASKGPHVKDFFLAWSHWKELEVKVGQFKRCFTFENPYNPWEVGCGDYAQLTKKLSGMSDYCGGESTMTGGRDLGFQLQGDVLPVGEDKHRLFHYQTAIFNGQGINHGDANATKDLMGTLQIQPVKDLFVGVFGWKGNMKYNNVTAQRNRYALGLKYEHEGWSARAEYAHQSGHKIGDYTYDAMSKTQQLIPNASNGRSDAWYATVGVPCTPWLKLYVKYDAYRDNAQNSSLSSIYTLCPNFQLHKNLLLQLQYNYVHSKQAADRHHNELWGMVYFRF